MNWEVEPHVVSDLGARIEALVKEKEAEARLEKYFDPNGPYSGAWFERLGRGVHSENEVGCHDLLSLNHLDVQISGLLIREILEEEEFRARISSQLEGIDSGMTLWDDAAADSLTAADDLWNTIRGKAHELEVGISDTKLSKLLARKRPNLIPISDEVVKTALPLPRGLDRWTAYRTVLRNRPSILARLEEFRGSVPQASHASSLRILDVLAWMSTRGRARVDPR